MRFDPILGDYEDNARRYRPGTGSFSTVDPSGFSSGTANLYGYTGNDPTNATDPSGLEEEAGSLALAGAYFGLNRGKAVELEQIRATAQALAYIQASQMGLGEWVAEIYAKEVASQAAAAHIARQMEAAAGPRIDPAQDPWTQRTLHRSFVQNKGGTAYAWEAAGGGMVLQNTALFGDTVKAMLFHVGTGLAVHAIVTLTLPLAAATVQRLGKWGWRQVGKGRQWLTNGKSLIKVQQATCFPAGTAVLAEGGAKPIESIRPGEQVWGYCFATREWVLRRVAETYAHDYAGDIVRITVAGEHIEATGNHPFWVVSGEGLEQREIPEHVPAEQPDAEEPGRWVDARELRVGDVLLLKTGQPGVMTELHFRQAAQKVYNLEVEEVHTYAVGAGQVLVHNRYINRVVRRGAIGNLSRYNGPKPRYAVNPAHVPGTLRKGKTPLPADAERVFQRAVPDDPVNPRHWYGKNAEGQIYRFSNGNDGTAHFSGIDGVGDGIRNITRYARQRLAGQ